MKKSIFIVSGLLFVIALLPVIGNSFMKIELDKRVQELNSSGVIASKDLTNSSYLHTSRHFEFLLKDSHLFLNSLQQYSDKQIPTYVDAIVAGMLVGVDVEYSNLPFAKAFTLEIYPLELSKELHESLEENDKEFTDYLTSFLHAKGVLYHIEYNLLNEDFKGYLKDIDESYKRQDGLKLDLKLTKSSFSGNGPLIAPNRVDSKLREFQFNVTQRASSLDIALNKLSFKNNFDSQSTYITSGGLQELLVNLHGTPNDMNLSMKKIEFNGSSNTQGMKGELYSKASIDSMQFDSQEIAFILEKFVLDFAASGLDKELLQKLQKSLSKYSLQESPLMQREVQNSLLQLFSKGLVLEIAKLSMKNISLPKDGALGGFSMKSKIRLKEDDLLLQRVALSPLLALTNIELFTGIKLSKRLYEKLLNSQSMLHYLTKYAREDGDEYVFDVEFVDAHMHINKRSVY